MKPFCCCLGKTVAQRGKQEAPVAVAVARRSSLAQGFAYSYGEAADMVVHAAGSDEVGESKVLRAKCRRSLAGCWKYCAGNIDGVAFGVRRVKCYAAAHCRSGGFELIEQGLGFKA